MLVALVEVLLAGVEPARLAAAARRARPARARRRACASSSAPARRPSSACAAAARERSAPTWPVSRARPSRRSATARRAATQRPLLGGERGLGVGAGGDGVARRPRSASSWPASSASCSRTAAASRSTCSGSRPGPHLAPASAAVRWRAPLGGQRRRAAQALLERRQAVPGLLRPGQRRRLRGDGLLELGLAGRPCRLSSASTAARRSRTAVSSRTSASSAARSAEQVVGEQPQPGVAQVGLHLRGAAGDLGLPAERLELAPQLGGEVAAGGRGWPASRRACAAPAPCACGASGRRPPPRRSRAGPPGRACSTASSWPCPTTTCSSRPMPLSLMSSCTSTSRQRAAVDGVLGRAVPEHQPGDADLGVLDRQHAVGVVDRERHLGAAERRARRRPGEDDVLHLAAAQRLGALLAEHPGDGVDDVALARAVRARRRR